LVSLYQRRSKIGLVGEEINVETGTWTSPQSHIGGGIDSYYEYLVKCAKLFGDPQCADMAQQSLRAVNRYLLDERESGLWYGQVDMATGRRTATTYGALQAFFPAVLALYGDVGNARRLQDSGWKMWTLHGIEPEELDYASLRVTADGYALRPEIMESAYYLFQATRDRRYLAMGRRFFEDLRKNCRVGHGYTVLQSVVTKKQGDLMPSYFLAETLKYLYLLFRPEALDFNRVVFNTEAHPLRRTAQ
ncbi:MAG TPA: glycoside hydrolase family 47 protein, partial [Thermoanaerobaculia bacterium]|nr:glycoside hydrolase family 47 protein [Thermoanaerobaculia bacterium]